MAIRDVPSLQSGQDGGNLSLRPTDGLTGNCSAAFSLIEIVLALGIISFALVGIMGLFPVAMKSAQESQRETRAAQIAMQIFNDLRGTPATNALIATSTNILTSQMRINLMNSSSNVVYYDRDGVTLGTNTMADAIFLGEILVTPSSPMAGLSRVQATVETPANAPAGSRSRYTFVTLMGQ